MAKKKKSQPTQEVEVEVRAYVDMVTRQMVQEATQKKLGKQVTVVRWKETSRQGVNPYFDGGLVYPPDRVTVVVQYR